MRFKDIAFSKEHRFSIGIEEETGHYFLSIPVSNPMVDYEEYYRIDKSEFDQFQKDMNAGLKFADQCRQRQMDDRLYLQPGTSRGVPR